MFRTIGSRFSGTAVSPHKNIHLVGDPILDSRNYYCFKNALNILTREYSKTKAVKETVTKSVQDIPFLGNTSECLLNETLFYKEKMQNQKSYFLENEDEADIVFRLNYLFDKRCSLIICDNVQYFDQKSLELLYLLITCNEEIFPFFKECKFILAYTNSNLELNPIIKKIYDNTETIKYQLLPIDLEEIDSALIQFGCSENIDKEIKKIIYQLSNGHLEVIKQISMQLYKKKDIIDSLKNSENETILENLLTQKLIDLGANGRQISELLEYASLIGHTFSNMELSQIVELNKQEFTNAIKRSNEMELINSNDKYSFFSHDIVQLIFRNMANSNINHYYAHMKECIKEIYPADYDQRIEIEIVLGETRQAAILAIMKLCKNNFNSACQNDKK